MNAQKLSGILHLCNLKNIARYIDLNKVQNNTIKEIMADLKEDIELTGNPQRDIKETLSKKDGKNILTFINYLDKKIKYEDVKGLINLIDNDQRKQILDYWSILSECQDFNILFEKDFSKMVENSYIDYSLVSVQIYQHKGRKEFVENLKKCDNVEARYLLHSIPVDHRFDLRRAIYGIGVTFTDMIDYASFYANYSYLWNIIIPVGNTISCIASEVFYDKEKKHKIYHQPKIVELDHFPTNKELKEKYEDLMVEKNGINFIEVETKSRRALESEEDIDFAKKNGRFIANEYVITEMEQTLPLYVLTLKRNEYLIVWRDPSFGKKTERNDALEERKMFIYKESKMNAYFVDSIEKGLEIIQRKRYNKIILISTIGKDLSGKKFVEVARKILSFDLMVLFFSNNYSHFSWLQKFPNALYTNENKFYEKYISNYNKNGLIQLKKEVENKYNIKLMFNSDFLSFPRFVDNENFSDLFFNDINENFRRVIIINKRNNKAIYMENGKVKLKSYEGLETNSFDWYITIIDNEITLFSNEFYLDADKNEGIAKGYPYMKRWKYEKRFNNYLLYFDDKNNMLTIDDDKALIRNENKKLENQLFNFIDIQK